MDIVTCEQVASCSSADVTDHKQAATAKSSGVVGRILELKKRRQHLSGTVIKRVQRFILLARISFDENVYILSPSSVNGRFQWLVCMSATICHITDTSVFRRHLKTHFFNLYFNT